MIVSELQMVYIVTAQNLPTLEEVYVTCNKMKGANTIVILRSYHWELLRAHRHPNGVIFYRTADQMNVENKPIKRFSIYNEDRFLRATELMEENALINIDNETLFQ